MKKQFHRVFTVVIVLVFVALTLPPTTFAAIGDSETITGTAYRDYNYNGTMDAAEPGVASLTVTATCALDDDNNPLTVSTDNFTDTTTTAANGTYTLAVKEGYQCRVVFSGLPSHLAPSAFGAGNNTSVQFVDVADGGNSAVNAGFAGPDDFCDSNPYVISNCFAKGAYNGANAGETAIATNLHSEGGSTASSLAADFGYGTANTNATINDVGTAYGGGWQSTTNTFFSAAFMKQFTGFGPDGPGAIYATGINPATGVTTTATSLWLDIYTLAGVTTCADPHANDLLAIPLWNTAAFAAVGRCSMADIEVSEDQSTLYVVNMTPTNGGQILAIDIATKTLVGGSPWTVPLTQGDCPAPTTDIHPGALAVEDGNLYFGLTCGADSTGLTADLRVYIYEMDPAVGIASATQVLNEPLTYNRNTHATNLDWNAWTDNPADVARLVDGTNTPITYHASPWLTDIELAGDFMAVGIRDRMGDQGPFRGPDAAGATEQITIPRGEILCAQPGGIGWTFESGGTCNGNVGAATHDDGGPGGQEFYEDGSDAHYDNHFGSLAYAPGFSDITQTTLSPNDPWRDFNDIPAGLANNGGFLHNSITNGAAQRGYILYPFDFTTNTGKANGLGDVEYLCRAAPIEVGNRIWVDVNQNGTQDPGEQPLSGVVVELIAPDGSTVLGTATTGSNGEYYFSNNTGTSTSSAIYGTNLAYSTTGYSVRIDVTQSALSSYSLTGANSSGDDTVDSDGTLAGQYATTTFNINSPGDNNHSFDFGFVLGSSTELVQTGQTGSSILVAGSVGLTVSAFAALLFAASRPNFSLKR